MKFSLIYIEITNVCGLLCDFCPPKLKENRTMSLEEFELAAKEAKKYTNEIALHIVGDPLILPDLDKYLEIAKKIDLRVNLTTSGFYLTKQSFKTLFQSSVKQINISLNSYNKNSMKVPLEKYLEPILDLCMFKLKSEKEQFINLRLWNIDSREDREFNETIFAKLNKFFNVDLNYKTIYNTTEKFIRIENKIRVHFDDYFLWPDLNNEKVGDGYCLGLRSHIGILSDLTVVPCCLDKEGIIALGNLNDYSLEEILKGERAATIRAGFNKGQGVEDLCQRCSYKERFKKD